VLTVSAPGAFFYQFTKSGVGSSPVRTGNRDRAGASRIAQRSGRKAQTSTGCTTTSTGHNHYLHIVVFRLREPYIKKLQCQLTPLSPPLGRVELRVCGRAKNFVKIFYAVFLLIRFLWGFEGGV
jgi:hypothetical protein